MGIFMADGFLGPFFYDVKNYSAENVFVDKKDLLTVDEHIAERQAGDEKGVGDVCSGKKRGGRKVTLKMF